MNPELIKWKQQVAAYFVFAKWQRRVAAFLLTSLLVLIFAPAVYLHYYSAKSTKANAIVVEQVAGLKVKTGAASYDGNNQQTDYAALNQPASSIQPSHSLFYFDPNTASFEQWQQLGLKDKTIRTIQNYLSKGGQFRKPEDIKRIYGLRPDEAEKLLPYIRIKNASVYTKPAQEYGAQEHAAYAKTYPAKTGTPIIEINSADSSLFIALPGIGSKLAARIINYRDKLHGFYSVDQVGETYGVPDSTFQKIKPRLQVNAALIQKININTASADELKTPYIKFNVANAIVQYRLHNGTFSSVADLKKIPLIDEFLYNRIAPYLKTE